MQHDGLNIVCLLPENITPVCIQNYEYPQVRNELTTTAFSQSCPVLSATIVSMKLKFHYVYIIITLKSIKINLNEILIFLYVFY